MTKAALYEALDHVNASREKREFMANSVEQQHPGSIPIILEIIKENNNPISSRACWVLEFIAKKNLNLILRNFDSFVNTLAFIRLESSIRSASKICELVMKAYFNKKQHQAKFILTETHLNMIAEVNFDWLIGQHKVAAQAYAMTTLLFIGHKIGWIHPELRLVLTQNYLNGSPAYKARARMTLDALNKIKNG